MPSNHQASRLAMSLSRSLLSADVSAIGRWFAISCVFFPYLGIGQITAFRQDGGHHDVSQLAFSTVRSSICVLLLDKREV